MCQYDTDAQLQASAKANRHNSSKEKVLKKYDIEPGLPFTVPYLVCKFQMIYFRGSYYRAERNAGQMDMRKTYYPRHDKNVGC